MRVIVFSAVMAYIENMSSETERQQIVQYLFRQKELGYFLRGPVSKPLRVGINEIRPGPHRLLFCYHQGEIVLLHAFRKKSRQTPECEIITALKIKRMYLAGVGGFYGYGT